MPEDFDPNRLAVEFVQKNAERLFSAAKTGVKSASNSVRVHLESSYRAYLTRVLDRHGRGKSFFIRTEPVPLYEFFVPLDLTTQRRRLSRPGIGALCSEMPKAIITGSGGCGKSMMMRHFVVDTIINSDKVPIFLELRQLNNSSETVHAALFRALQDNGLALDSDFFEKAMKAGHFVILLDGFDEVALTGRKRISKEIQQLATKYPANWVVMSSRPDNALEGWEAFTRLSVAPLSLKDAVDLVSRLQFDNHIKSGFIADMRATLFKRHESFLSNPLLLSIMLFTYIDVAHIPDKLTTFYGQAYDSLFQRHDALKGGFQRERKSGLDIQDFGRAFAAFALLSFDKRELSFSWARALELFELSKPLCAIEFQQDCVLEDSVQAVCLLLEDGIELTFAHRSFQEYFVARFIQASAPETKERLVARISPTVESDNVMGLLHELDPYVVERHYLLPALAVLRAGVGMKKKVGMTQFVRYIRLLHAEFGIHRSGREGLMAMIKDTALYHALRMSWERYPDLHAASSTNDSHPNADALPAVFIAEYGRDGELKSSALRISSPFAKALAQSEFAWGIQYLKDLFVIEDTIRNRHATTLASLEQVLLPHPSRTRARLRT